MTEWHWPQITYCIGMTVRTLALLRAVDAKQTKRDQRMDYIAIMLIAIGGAYILQRGGFW